MRNDYWFEDTLFAYNERDHIEKEQKLKVIFNFAHDNEEKVLKVFKEMDNKEFQRLCKAFNVDPETLEVDEEYVKDRLYND